MSRFHSYITSATKIINTYSAGKPLPGHLKSFFAADKKFGSRDRRTISSLCYFYFRTGKAFKEHTVEEKILFGLFLCENKSSELLRFFLADLDEKIHLPIAGKISFLKISQADIFPFAMELGADIEKSLFTLSFLQQPAMYLRIRPGRHKAVTDKLNVAAIEYAFSGDNCLKLGHNIAADKILDLNREVVIQDANSQKVLDYLETTSFASSTQKISSWDCCAASGGKSILLFDKLKGNLRLTVSDIRENILMNLQKRLQQAGINIYKSFLTDLSKTAGLSAEEKFAIIICDVPCTGSGTWGRSPEQLYFFKKETINDYAARQKQIVSNTIPQLAKEGLFFYITCSVFKKENEEVVDFIKEKFQLQLMQIEYLKGYENEADTMFIAVFKRN